MEELLLTAACNTVPGESLPAPLSGLFKGLKNLDRDEMSH